MGIYDRDYVFRKRPSDRVSPLSANTWIIIINVVIFVMGALSPPFQRAANDWGHLSTDTVTYAGGLQFWRFLTFQFLHANLSHVFFNMFGLYMFGAMVEDYLGRSRYIAFYLTTGVMGGLLFMVLNALGALAKDAGMQQIPGLLVYNTNIRLVGASAGVFGVIMACAFISPNSIINLLIPPIPMKLRTFAYIYVAMAAANLLFRGKNAGGDAAHLGGAIAGYILIRNAHLLRDFFDVFTDSRRPKKRTGPPDRPASPRQPPRPDEAEVDRILAKVNQHGLQSLSESEKATLRRATEARTEP